MALSLIFFIRYIKKVEWGNEWKEIKKCPKCGSTNVKWVFAADAVYVAAFGLWVSGCSGN